MIFGGVEVTHHGQLALVLRLSYVYRYDPFRSIFARVKVLGYYPPSSGRDYTEYGPREAV